MFANFTSRMALILVHDLLAAVAAVLAMAGIVAWFLKPPPPQPASHLTINLPSGSALATAILPLAYSPDGAHLAYVGTAPGSDGQLFLRTMDDPAPKPLAGTEGAAAPLLAFAGALDSTATSCARDRTPYSR